MFSTIACVFGGEKEKKTKDNTRILIPLENPRLVQNSFPTSPHNCTQWCAKIKKAGKQFPKWTKYIFPFKYPNFFYFHNSSTHQQSNYPSAWCSHFLWHEHRALLSCQSFSKQQLIQITQKNLGTLLFVLNNIREQITSNVFLLFIKIIKTSKNRDRKHLFWVVHVSFKPDLRRNNTRVLL